jgi:hypothetical protein
MKDWDIAYLDSSCFLQRYFFIPLLVKQARHFLDRIAESLCVLKSLLAQFLGISQEPLGFCNGIVGFVYV